MVKIRKKKKKIDTSYDKSEKKIDSSYDQVKLRVIAW